MKKPNFNCIILCLLFLSSQVEVYSQKLDFYDEFNTSDILGNEQITDIVFDKNFNLLAISSNKCLSINKQGKWKFIDVPAQRNNLSVSNFLSDKSGELYATNYSIIYKYDANLSTFDTLLTGFSHYLFDENNNLILGNNFGYFSKYENGSFVQITFPQLGINENIIKVQISKTGKYCLLTTHGLYIQDELKNFKRFGINEGLLSSEISSIYIDNLNKLWINYSINNIKFSCLNLSDTKEIMHYSNVLISTIKKVILDQDGTNWLLTTSGVLWEKNKLITYPKINLDYSIINDIEIDENGVFWLSCCDGIYQYSNGVTIEKYSKNKGLASKNINSIIEVDEGKLLIGSDLGLCEYYNDDFNYYENIFAPNCLTLGGKFLLYDSKKNLWVNTNNSISKLGIDQTISRYNSTDGAPEKVNKMYEGKNHNYWILAQLLYKFDGLNFEIIKTPGFGIYDMNVGMDGVVYVLCTNGAYAFNDNQWSKLLSEEVDGGSIVISKENEIFVLTHTLFKRQMYRLINNKFELFTHFNIINDRANFVVNDSFIWTAFFNRLIRLNWMNGDTVSFPIDIPISYEPNKNETIFMDSKNRIWIAYQKGLVKFDENGLTNVSNADSVLINKLYPNPNKGEFTLRFHLNKISPTKILVSDINGNILEMKYLDHLQIGQNYYQYKLIDPKIDGNYIITLESGNERVSQKIVIKN
jgi:hypothetical protein